MAFLYVQSIRHPWIVSVLMVGAVIAVSPGMKRLTLRTDGMALVPPEASEVIHDAAARKAFGIEDLTSVVVDTGRADGIYDVEVLKAFKALERGISQSGMFSEKEVTSLVTEKSDGVVSGTIVFRTMLDPMPHDEKGLARLKQDIDEIGIFKGTLVAVDASALAILIETPRTTERSVLHLEIERIIGEVGAFPHGVTVFMAGPPIAESQLGTHILEDLLGTRVLRWMGELGMTPPVGEAFREAGRHRLSMIAVALGVMGLVFLLAFRRPAAVGLPLMEVGACLVFTFSLMGWFGTPVYLTVAILPVILTAIGVADELHVFMRYRGVLREREAKGDSSAVEIRRDAVRVTMDEMWRPVLKTSVTSSIGFLSFALSPIEPVRVFGLYMAVGIGFCFLWSMTVVPATLVVVPAGWLVRGGRSSPGGRSSTVGVLGVGGGGGFFERLGRFGVRRRVALMGILVGVLVAAPFGARRVVVQDSWVDAFGPASETSRATRRLNEAFFGAHLLSLDLTASHVEVDEAIDVASFDRHSARIRKAEVEGHIGDTRRLIGEWGEFFVRGSGIDAGPIRDTVRGKSAKAFGATILAVRDEGDDVVLDLELRVNQDLTRQLDLSEGVRWGMKVAPGAGRFIHPGVLEAVAGLEAFIEAKTELAVGGVVGFHEQVATTNYMVRGRREEMRRTPDNHYRVNLSLKRYERMRGAHRLREILLKSRDRCVVTVFMKDANFVAVERLMGEIREYADAHLAPMGISVGYFGDVAVSQAMIGAIVETQVRSLMLSLLGIWVVTSLLSGSVVWGLFCVAPAGLAVYANFAVMGMWGIPLGVATSMFSGVTIGVGVDFAIHLMERARWLARQGADAVESIVGAVREVGPAVLVDGLGVALGFGVLMVSQVPANQRLGVLVMVAVGSCLLSTALFLPAGLAIFKPKFLGSK